MSDCKLVLKGDRYFCVECGWSYRKLIRRSCPGEPPKPKQLKLSQPGDMLAYLIAKVTGKDPDDSLCGCPGRKATMNEWGWWSCWKNRDVIAGWLVSEAEKAGHTVGKSKCLSLLLAAFREMKRKKKAEKPDGN